MCPSKKVVGSISLLALLFSLEARSEEEFFFDDNMMPGVDSISRFNKDGSFLPGEYSVNIFLNGEFKAKSTLEFKEVGDKVEACFSKEGLKSIGVKEEYITTKDGDGCVFISSSVSGGSEKYDPGSFRLDLIVPQMYVDNVPKNYVSPDYWEAGESMLYANYVANQYYVKDTGGDYSFTNRNTYIGYDGGFNIGLWRFRQVGSWRHDNHTGSRWNRNQSYVKRAIPAWKSELSIGESSTTGRFFSGLNYRGVALSTDERMKPDYQRNYVPIIQGVAQTNAIVRVRQNNREIYQTTVVSGPFEITDLQASSLNGDLDVIIEEANGQVSSFVVPFAAVPDSLKMGQDRYDVIVGQTRDVGDHDGFAQFTYERGISNAITLNGGARVADDYQALALGGVYATRFGAFGFNNTFSSAKVPDEGRKTGWMGGITYSQTFAPTQTVLTLAGYRYSTEGYRDFGDVAGLRRAHKKHGPQGSNDWYSSTYLQRSRFEVMINQHFDEYGSLYASASRQTYRGGRGHDTQYQAGYSKVFFNNINVSLSVSRQTTGSYELSQGYYQDLDYNPNYYSIGGRKNTIGTITVSLPLDFVPVRNAPTLSATYLKGSDKNESFQTMVSGTANVGDTSPISYFAGHTRDIGNDRNQNSFGANKNFSKVSLSSSASFASKFKQASVTATGTIVAHSGGITLGQYAGDTFAIVEAKGAKGAKVTSTNDVRIDRFGYAVVPYLTPFKYNSVSLSSEGVKNSRVDVDGSQQRVAPYAGAALKLVFETVEGYPVLITIDSKDDMKIPIGSNVLDSSGKVVGMVGQGSMAYIRSEQKSGDLTIEWGDSSEDKCVVPIDLDSVDTSEDLIKVSSACI